MTHPQHILATGSLIQNKKNQILLVKTEWRGWEIPGGQVEEGENVIFALKREVLEEACVKINIKTLSAIYSSIRQPPLIIIDFISDYQDGIVKPDHVVTDARWFTKEDAMVSITSKPMIYRLEWLLGNKNKIRFASYSKNPFKIISENIF